MPALDTQLRRLLNIHPGEGRMAVLVISLMLLTSAGLTLGSTGIETLFFARFGVGYLPSMYMLLGVLSFLTTLGLTVLLGRMRRELLYLSIPIGIVLTILTGWLALFSKFNFIFPILWLGKEVANTLMSLVMWGIAGTVCDTRQSKRLFPLFNAGRILGAVLGGLGMGALVSLIGTQNVLLVWAGMMALVFVCIRALVMDRQPAAREPRSRRRQKQPSFLQDLQRGYQYVRSSVLMRWVSLASVLFSILYFSIALPFSKSAAARFPDENALAGFLGLFNGLSTAAAFLASIFLANRLYARIGIMSAILVLPVIYLFGFGALTVANVFSIIIVFRFIQILWLAGIADAAYPAMFNVVPAAQRDQVRSFIGGVPEQAGTFLAGAMLWVGDAAFSARGLAFAGLIAAAITTFAIWKASRAYQQTLVDSLRAGRLSLFASNDRFRLAADGAAMQVALDGMRHPDRLIRLTSAEILAQLDLPEVTSALVDGLRDEDLEVRFSALKGLARPDASAALLDVAALLSDPAPGVRACAVDTLRALTPYPRGLQALLGPLLQDGDALVRVRAAVALTGLEGQEAARLLLRQMAILGSEDERVMALEALVEVGDPGSFQLFATELEDVHAPSAVRRAAAAALGQCGIKAIPILKTALATEDVGVQAGIAAAFGRIGEAGLTDVVAALKDQRTEAGALMAMENLPTWKEAGPVREYVNKRVASALHYETLHQALGHPEDGRLCLLEESLGVRARRDGIFALRALGTLGDRETITTAIETLKNKSPAQYANALEALEGLPGAKLIRPLLRVWEPAEAVKIAVSTPEIINQLVNDDDAWLRSCAVYAGSLKEEPMENLASLSIMDRVLWLRRVPLLADLAPSDLQRVAAIANELTFADKDVISEQGEVGDEMFVIISGEVRVLVDHEGQARKEIALRAAGDVVGEMAIISGDVRNASLIAAGDVHLLCLERAGFESLLRERPEVSMAVMRELCHRLKQMM